MMTDERMNEILLMAEVYPIRGAVGELVDDIKRLRAELSRYKTPNVDDVEFLPSDPKNHEVR